MIHLKRYEATFMFKQALCRRGYIVNFTLLLDSTVSLTPEQNTDKVILRRLDSTRAHPAAGLGQVAATEACLSSPVTRVSQATALELRLHTQQGDLIKKISTL